MLSCMVGQFQLPVHQSMTYNEHVHTHGVMNGTGGTDLQLTVMRSPANGVRMTAIGRVRYT